MFLSFFPWHHRDNLIVSISPEAFIGLTVLGASRADYNKKIQDENYTDIYGIGVWPHKNTPGSSFFGGGQEWASLAVALAPNPMDCLWSGPHLNDFNCQGNLLPNCSPSLTTSNQVVLGHRILLANANVMV